MTYRQTLSSVLCAILAASIIATARTQTIPIPIKALSNLTTFFVADSPSVSRDGRFVAYTVQNPSSTGEKHTLLNQAGFGGCTIWIADLRTGTAHALTDSHDSVSYSPSWSPDGTKLAFISDRDGKPKVWIWDKRTGATYELNDTEASIAASSPPKWADDDTVVALFQAPSNAVSSPIPNEPIQSRIDKQSPLVLTYTPLPAMPASKASLLYRHFGGRSPEIFVGLVKLTDRSVIHKIGPHGQSLRFSVAPDGERIAIIDIHPIYETTISNLDIADIRTGNYKILVKGIHNVAAFSAWSPNSQAVGYIAEMHDTASEADIVNVASGRVVKQSLNVNRIYIMPAPRWSASGTIAYIADNRGLWRYQHGRFELIGKGNRYFVRDIAVGSDERVSSYGKGAFVDLVVRERATKREGIARLNLASGIISPIAIRAFNFYAYPASVREHNVLKLPDQSFAFEAESAIHPEELWNVDSSGSWHQVGETNPQLTGYVFGKSTFLQRRSASGIFSGSALLLPIGYHSGHHYPLVVFVYRGSRGSDNVNMFGLTYFNMQILASRGYAVLYPDTSICPLRSSRDCDEELVSEVMSGIKDAVRSGYADERNVAVMGQSEGGYNVATLITKTALFKAAIMVDGPTDLIADYFSMDEIGNAVSIDLMEQGKNWLGSTPWADLDRYIKYSPIFHLDRVRTPLLILQGEADDDVPFQQANEMFVGLRRLNKEVTYVRYPGEGHVETNYTLADQQDWWNRILSWLDSHLRPAHSPL